MKSSNLDDKKKGSSVRIAQYRRYLTAQMRSHILEKYMNLIENDVGGLFTPTTRGRLLGTKPKKGVAKQDTSDFYYDVRSRAAAGLADLQLLSEIGHDAQLQNIFMATTHAELNNEPYRTDLNILLTGLLRTHDKQDFHTKEDILWRAELAEKIVNSCMAFFKNRDLITSKAHLRVVDEIKDMMASEISNLDDKRIKEVRTSGATEGYWVWMSKDFVESNKIKKKFDEYRVKSKAMHTKRECDGLAKLVSKKSKVTPATESKAEVSNHEGL